MAGRLDGRVAIITGGGHGIGRAYAHGMAREGARVLFLVNNAAIFATIPMSRGAFDRIPIEEWDRMMAVNLRGTWLASRACIEHMRQRGYGKIITISSGTALKGSAGRIHYVTSKAGIIGFTRVLAREVGEHGICVNCIAPGDLLRRVRE